MEKDSEMQDGHKAFRLSEDSSKDMHEIRRMTWNNPVKFQVYQCSCSRLLRNRSDKIWEKENNNNHPKKKRFPARKPNLRSVYDEHSLCSVKIFGFPSTYRINSWQTRRALGRARTSATQSLMHENISGPLHFWNIMRYSAMPFLALSLNGEESL